MPGPENIADHELQKSFLTQQSAKPVTLFNPFNQLESYGK